MSKRSKAAKGAKPAPKPTPPPKPPKAPPRRKPMTQVAALCLNDAKDKVLLITSRGSGRWIVPKGWPMRNRSLPGTALQEAWEEAGVEGTAGKKELGRYHYEKLRDHGFAIPVEVRVFPITVHKLRDSFPESGERKRAWFAPDEAAKLVEEHALKALIAETPRFVADGLMPKRGS